MINEISELQKKRAINIIWNAANAYDFSPDFKAYDKDGAADLYWNCIIGAVRKHYEYNKIEKLFSSFLEHEESDTYEGLLWLGLENCVFQKEVLERPVLANLRIKYAEKFISEFKGNEADDYMLYDSIALAHFRRVLGIQPKLSKYSIRLLDDLEFSAEMSTDQIVEKTSELFKQWFYITLSEKKEHRKLLPDLLFRKKGKTNGKRRYRKFGIGYADRPDGVYGTSVGPKNEKLQVRSKMTAEELREFMTGKFGLPMFKLQQTLELERLLCAGNHTGCHLHFTYGDVSKGAIHNGFEALQKEREAKQIKKNVDYYNQNIAHNRTVIAKLSNKIQNSVLLHLHPLPVKSNSGQINPGVIWRALYFDENKVFTKNEQSDMGDLSVDILLDASTSQKNRQEIVSSQGYIIAESLTKCGIPCRVMSYCSMTGYTILRVFRDYNEKNNNDKIFEYVANGCNRDGLAIRAAHHLINQSRYEHKILIVLSDVKPNDVVRIPGKNGDRHVAYEYLPAVTDTAYEVRSAKADGISVVCVFTGEDEDVSSAKLVYGRDFARIQSLDKMADTVGMLIQSQIKNI